MEVLADDWRDPLATYRAETWTGRVLWQKSSGEWHDFEVNHPAYYLPKPPDGPEWTGQRVILFNVPEEEDSGSITEESSPSDEDYESVFALKRKKEKSDSDSEDDGREGRGRRLTLRRRATPKRPFACSC